MSIFRSIILYSATVFFGAVLFGVITPIGAATYQINGPTDVSATAGAYFDVSIEVNAPEESVNALEGVVSYSAAALEVREIKDNNSAISLWVKRPVVTIDKTKNLGTIAFSGLIPGGASIEKARLFTVRFVFREGVSQGIVTLTNGLAYLSDGQGTKINLLSKPLKVALNFKENLVTTAVETSTISQASSTDKLPPEVISVSVARSDLIFEGRWFLAFNAADKDSGIDHYEVQESSDAKPDPTQWTRAVNPYLLQDQNRTSYIFVKAVDRAGNERIKFIEPQVKSLATYQRIIIWCIIVLSGVSILFLWVRRRNITPGP